jgi:hypothetical protein
MQYGTQGAPPRLAGSGIVDIRGWLEAGFRTVTADAGVWVLATLLFLLASNTGGLLAVPLQIGMHQMAIQKEVQGRVRFETLFHGFRRFGPVLLAVLLMLVATTLVVMVTMALWFGVGFAVAAVPSEASPVRLIVILLGAIPLIVLSCLAGVVGSFWLPAVGVGCMSPIDGLTASWNVVRRNLAGFFWMNLVFGFIQMLGLLALGVGILFTFPLIEAARAHAYTDYFGTEGWDRP